MYVSTPKLSLSTTVSNWWRTDNSFFLAGYLLKGIHLWKKIKNNNKNKSFFKKYIKISLLYSVKKTFCSYTEKGIKTYKAFIFLRGNFGISISYQILFCMDKIVSLQIKGKKLCVILYLTINFDGVTDVYIYFLQWTGTLHVINAKLWTRDRDTSVW